MWTKTKHLLFFPTWALQLSETLKYSFHANIFICIHSIRICCTWNKTQLETFGYIIKALTGIPYLRQVCRGSDMTVLKNSCWLYGVTKGPWKNILVPPLQSSQQSYRVSKKRHFLAVVETSGYLGMEPQEERNSPISIVIVHKVWWQVFGFAS